VIAVTRAATVATGGARPARTFQVAHVKRMPLAQQVGPIQPGVKSLKSLDCNRGKQRRVRLPAHFVQSDVANPGARYRVGESRTPLVSNNSGSGSVSHTSGRYVDRARIGILSSLSSCRTSRSQLAHAEPGLLTLLHPGRSTPDRGRRPLREASQPVSSRVRETSRCEAASAASIGFAESEPAPGTPSVGQAPPTLAIWRPGRGTCRR